MEFSAFKYGEFEKVIDFTDYQVLERYEKNLEEYQARLTSATDGSKSHATQIRGLFETVVFMLDSTLGEGTSNKVLGGTTSLSAAMDAFKSLVSYKEEQSAQTTESWEKTAEKYSPKARKIPKKSPKGL